MWGGSRAVWKRRFSCYGPWETVESCVVGTSTSIYRRLQESPRQPRGGMNSWGTPPPPPFTPSNPPARGHLLKSESEDSGVEMASNEHSPSTPLGSESSFSLDNFPPKSTPPRQEVSPEHPPQPPRSRSASRKLVQAAQRSRRQRGPGRCPRQLGQRSASASDLLAEPERDPRQLDEPTEDPQGAAVPEAGVAGQGLRYLEHVCQMLERVARLQQDNRLLRQRAAGSRHHPRPDTTPTREMSMQDPGGWKGERFRPRSCSDSQAPALDPEPCRRTWGHSASSPSLLEPSECGVGAPSPEKDGRSPWGRVKVLLTRLTRRSLRGGRCR